ncbi:monofunctional biosynthetic peptidoglycan transglycosylase [Fodinicurvata sp. EGI_FJ10296]|uniref:monofunctional biosynthetic peptidoglycan transglycosylase n=1 Tax=Fodinicurvata sp. EGI_FJ10296 TaxID=3231908 RepID=UPI003452B64C
MKRSFFRRFALRRLLRRLAILVLVIFVLLPVLLAVVYKVAPVPLTPLMVIRTLEGEGFDKDWVPMEQISSHLMPAILAAEDNLFCQHRGFDWGAFREVLDEFRQGERLRGGSTVSMQTAKNVYLWPGRSWIRKGLEAAYTPMLELLWGKRRIAEVYMNIVEFGPGVYGAEAAARHHFGVSAADLTSRQAAVLAVVLPNPRRFDAGRPSGYIAERASVIQRRVGQLGPLVDCVR